MSVKFWIDWGTGLKLSVLLPILNRVREYINSVNVLKGLIGLQEGEIWVQMRPLSKRSFTSILH